MQWKSDYQTAVENREHTSPKKKMPQKMPKEEVREAILTLTSDTATKLKPLMSMSLLKKAQKGQNEKYIKTKPEISTFVFFWSSFTACDVFTCNAGSYWNISINGYLYTTAMFDIPIVLFILSYCEFKQLY